MPDTATIEIVQRHATRLNLETAAQPLLDAIDPRVSLVLIGEATHGTHEFYRLRADLTRALVQHREFTCVAAEADWPDAYRANRWVRLLGHDQTAEDALADFTRFPRWSASFTIPGCARSCSRSRHPGWPVHWRDHGSSAPSACCTGRRPNGQPLFLRALPEQFDVLVHIDRTRALEPLEKWGRHELDLLETYPTGV